MRERKGIIATLLVLIATVVAHAWQQPPPRDATPLRQPQPGIVRGRVIDDSTGRPVPRATVRLGSASSKARSSITDAEGQFEFTDVAPGLVAASAEKTGYMLGAYPEHSGLRSLRAPPVLTPGKALEIEIKMTPAAAVAGRVLDRHGDPVENAEVTILRGGGPAGSTRTNDLGEFRIPRLRAGSYLLLAVPPDRNVDAVPSGEAPPQPLPTFYPGVPVPAQATTLRITSGQQLTNLDVVLFQGQRTVVNGVLVSQQEWRIRGGIVNAQMILPEFSNGMPGSSALIGEDGSFRLELAPGDYQLTATTEPHWSSNVPDMTQNGLVEITVGSSPSQGVTVPVGRAAVVTGSISFDGGQPPEHPGSVSVPFSAPYAGACRATERVEIAEDWTFKVEGLLGTCRAPVASTFGRWTLTSVTIDGQEMLNGTMKFEPGQRISNVALVFSDRRGGIKLRVADGKGQLTQEYVALAFPADRQQWIPWKSFVRPFTPIREEIRDLASASGRRLPESSRDTIALPVGDYYVVALDDFLLQTQLADPGLLERLIPSATRISVTEGAPREVLLQRRISSDLK